ncbi:MAG: sulfite exporter TauE/SafE family protein [Thaumarchaeota archaeon]|nr:sulfite exporter TauE/SafE family protein [Candidatus Calditenuaceae archaeon]
MLALFTFSFVIGLISPMAGIGGGVLFTPILLAFTSINVDLVRGTGIALATANSFTASGTFVRAGVVNLRLGLLAALIAATCAIVGVFLRPPGGPLLNSLLGLIMLSVVLTYNIMKGGVEYPRAVNSDFLAERLQLNASYYDRALNEHVSYAVERTVFGFLLFGGMGFISGAFGVGAGWGAVPIINLLMRVPLRPSITTSQLIVSISGLTAMWIYVLQGAVVPLMAIPSLMGGMLGVLIGSRIAVRAGARYIRYTVIAIMSFTSLRLLLSGLGIWR